MHHIFYFGSVQETFVNIDKLNVAVEETTPGQSTFPTGWDVTSSDPLVDWHISSIRSSAGGQSIRYADESLNNYEGIGTNNGTMDTTEFSVPAGFTTYQLRCDVFAATEAGTSWDVYSIQVYSTGLGLLTTIAKANLGDGNTSGSFSTFTNTISSSVAGRNDIYLRFTFDTGDAAANATEGVYFDNFQLILS